MKITGSAWSKYTGKTHTIYDRPIGSVEIEGSEVFVSGVTNELSLTGEYRLKISFTEEDLRSLVAPLFTMPLMKRIVELEEEVQALSENMNL